MMRHAALLRAVNVGGNNGVPMASLRAIAQALYLGEPRTLLQSGNLVFSSEGLDGAELERRLEAAVADELGVKTEICVRSAAAWARLIEANPFSEAAAADPAHLLLVAFKTAPRADAAERLADAYKGPERVGLVEGHAYVVYPEGVGNSKLTPAMLGRHLGPGTARNWNTVLKLDRMLAE